jgi:hypothetical protein
MMKTPPEWKAPPCTSERRSDLCILANLSMKLGRTLAWDEKTGRVTGDDEANRLLLRRYRNPRVHPTPGSV